MLQDALALALKAIVARLDPDEGFRPFFRITLDPPCAHHDSWDFVDMAGRYVESMAMIRQLTGLSAPAEEEALKRFLLSMQEEDGLFYNREPFLADMFCQSRALLALCTWFMDTGEPQIMESLRRQVHGLMRIAVPAGSGLRYPCNLYRQGEWIEGGLFYEAKDLWNVKPGYGGTQLEGIAKYAGLSGDEEALEFVRAYLRYFLQEARVVREDGSFEGHLHSQGIVPTMVAAAMVASMDGDRELLGLCERFLAFTLSHCSSFGWVPDGIGWPTCETCALGDVIHLMTLLGGHWKTVERFAKNQLIENQFRRREAWGEIESMVVGSFASWAKPNDLLGGPDLEGCCLGGGVRGIFHVLNSAIAGDEVRMLFDLETESVKVEVRDRGRSARIWNTGTQPVSVRGNAIVQPGAMLEIAVPQEVRTVNETVAGVEYQIDWLGDAVTCLLPRGERYPTYVGRPKPSSAVYPKQGDRIRW